MNKTMRKRPYTKIGIKRLTCSRKGCTNKASSQWQICADNNNYRPICDTCDEELNRTVLEFMGFPNIEEKMKKYQEQE